MKNTYQMIVVKIEMVGQDAMVGAMTPSPTDPTQSLATFAGLVSREQGMGKKLGDVIYCTLSDEEAPAETTATNTAQATTKLAEKKATSSNKATIT